jgi:hypothetical protein
LAEFASQYPKQHRKLTRMLEPATQVYLQVKARFEANLRVLGEDFPEFLAKVAAFEKGLERYQQESDKSAGWEKYETVTGKSIEC